MYPQTHLLSGLAVGAVAQKLGYFSYSDTLILTSLTVLLDIDHYIYFVCKYKTLSFFKAWQAAVLKKEMGERTAIHHALGFLLFTIFFIGIFFIDHKWALILCLAYYIHILFDYLPNDSHRVKFSLLKLSFRLSYYEIILDGIFLSLIIALFFI